MLHIRTIYFTRMMLVPRIESNGLSVRLSSNFPKDQEMTFITQADAEELFWSEIGVANKFKPQHEKFLKFLQSHDTVTFEAAMQQIDSLIGELTPKDGQPRRVLTHQAGAR